MCTYIKRFFILSLTCIFMLTGCPLGPERYHYRQHGDLATITPSTICYIYVDSTFSDVDRKIIEGVVSEWNGVMNGYVKVKIAPVSVDSGDSSQLLAAYKKVTREHRGFLLLNLKVSDEINEGYIDGGTLAYVNAIGNGANLIVILRERVVGHNLHKILLHEFGHVFGARHSVRGSLMYSYYGRDQVNCVDRATALQIANYYGFDVDKMNYCVDE